MLKLLIGLLVPFMFIFVIKSQYSLIQAEHYEITRYFKHEFKKKLIIQNILIAMLVASFYVKSYAFLLIFIVSLAMNFMLVNDHKIKYTKRIKRFWVVYYLITYLSYVLLPFGYIGSFMVLNNLNLFVLFISHVFSSLLENLLMKKHIKEAKIIIKDKIVIGVTGSYGKTSSKNIIYDLLENVCNISKTPKSYNTKVGIIKSIKENVSVFDEMFVCEYGVDKKKGMDKLLKIVKPNITLITEIGPQHLLTFKNMKNIVNEKIKLAKVLKEDEVAVINNDNKYLKHKIKELNCRVITYGIDSFSDVMAKNIEVSKSGSCFDLYINNKKIKKISIKLLGRHNVLNTLGAIGVLYALNLNLKNIEELVHNIKPVEHRLQLKTINDIKVIDDSFNSNEVGFKTAIDVLSLMKEEKIVITPGIIEQGKNSDKVNYMLGKYMANKIDLVILVEKNYKVIKEGLICGKFDEERIIIKDNFNDAWQLVKQFKEKDNKIILIENDLPNIYLK